MVMYSCTIFYGNIGLGAQVITVVLKLSSAATHCISVDVCKHLDSGAA